MELKSVSKIIESDLCAFCGACIAVCPKEALTLDSDEPTFDPEKCIECRLCTFVCPTINRGVKESPVLAAYTARTLLDEVSNVAQDGGVVTTLLIQALDEGAIEAAIVCLDSDEPLKPMPFVVTTKHDLIRAAGSKYVSCPSLSSLREIVDKYQSIAFVGVPCQVRAAQFMRKKAPRYAKNIKLVIGLFCTESYPYTKFCEMLRGKMGVDPSAVIRSQIKHGKFSVKLKDGEIKAIKIKETKEYARNSCLFCGDFAAESSDISVGSIGSEEGWSTVLIRNQMARDLFERSISSGLIEAKELNEDSKAFVEKFVSLKKKRLSKELPL
ncbi:MAG TPA: 4Fe-4S dicluster domain-containing protein [Candidatus Korarchaeota archaeon]|nr:4Fe-4S dicluster domain-containing protein [Candidatus Korarchaeota archaeon]